MLVRRLEPADIPSCERVLATLPDWFGIEESNRAYIRDLETLPAYVAEVDGAIAGFLAIKDHFPMSSEVHVLAVDRAQHRQGIGRALLAAAERDLVAASVRLLQVKTLGPSEPDQGYESTRSFYGALGFIPLEETAAFWGAENPTLIMVKPLPST